MPNNRFDLLMSLLGCWLLAGLYLDGWAHIHLEELESFFTPWHAVLYSGFFALAGTLVLRILLQRAVPPGYGPSLGGVGLFLAGGAADMVWHIVFGVEAGVDALLSPTHLFLAVGGVLIITGPLRATLRREEPQVGWRALLPAMLSLLTLLSILAFFTEYAHPFSRMWSAAPNAAPDGDEAFLRHAVGIAGVILQSALLVGVLFFARRRWKLPRGGVFLIVTASSLLVLFMHQKYLVTGFLPLALAAALGGIAGEVLSRVSLRLFAALLPASLYAFYFTAVLLTTGTWWSVHFWPGAVVVAGITGLLVSYLG